MIPVTPRGRAMRLLIELGTEALVSGKRDAGLERALLDLLQELHAWDSCCAIGCAHHDPEQFAELWRRSDKLDKADRGGTQEES